MNVDIPNDLGQFVRQLIADGVVANENEALVEGLRLLQSREQLRRAVNLGIEQLDRGEGLDGEEVFDRLERRIDEVARDSGER
jgi:antitoxin ParD1/3/4